MNDDHAKSVLVQELRWAREALAWKLDGLSEYDARRPLTATGTNLLGLVKHTATWEARYLGEVMGRPFPESLPSWELDDDADLWVRPEETRADVLGLAERSARHAEETVAALPLDAPGHVPWWSRPEVSLFAVMVHVLDDTLRHAGHADILREQLDGRTGVSRGQSETVDEAARSAYWTTVENAARAAAEQPIRPPSCYE